MNLKNSHIDLQQDQTILKSTIIALTETWLVRTELEIDGYKSHFNSIGPGKGIAVYMKDDNFKVILDIKQEKMQLTKLESQELEVIIVYRSEQGNTSELLCHLQNMIRQDVATVICGDFNICYQTNKNNRITKYLEKNGFTQSVGEPTHIKGRQIDHFYFKPGKNITENPIIYRYSPYYSDHDAICATFKMTEKNSL